MSPATLYDEILGEETRMRMHLNGWIFSGYYDAGELVASAMTKGPEIHVVVAPAWRGRAMSRRRVREFLTPLLTRHGYLTTRVLHEKTEHQRFIERVGFKKTWEDSMFRYYELNELPFGRKVK